MLAILNCVLILFGDFWEFVDEQQEKEQNEEESCLSKIQLVRFYLLLHSGSSQVSSYLSYNQHVHDEDHGRIALIPLPRKKPIELIGLIEKT